jgi:hypothetical protein
MCAQDDKKGLRMTMCAQDKLKLNIKKAGVSCGESMRTYSEAPEANRAVFMAGRLLMVNFKKGYLSSDKRFRQGFIKSGV